MEEQKQKFVGNPAQNSPKHGPIINWTTCICHVSHSVTLLVKFSFYNPRASHIIYFHLYSISVIVHLEGGSLLVCLTYAHLLLRFNNVRQNHSNCYRRFQSLQTEKMRPRM
ncbi:hypothetical protein F5878DRAFT_599913 [Lentinula raphanica]|uniref:Uncharacterized protein n=1 Tax=Lentinula raphanica TaxID=153919 RepID=A0AA38PLJ8_9AGAR|nr:hypothetical protein F5880DRAFT_1573698 [Lentinula raphanica]KAJ3845165.1 hypothetical protein F5878DRAFT_599913 [Lentinula raphanica]